jgi:branched-chain amino acid transport system substrate-binding protein
MRAPVVLALTGLIVATTWQAWAGEKKYDPGASDTEIKIGQTIAYSGPASTYAITGRIPVAYFRMLNETKGGINGRKITLLSEDDAYSPPKTMEVTRKLVEQDGVLAMVGSMGTASQTTVQKYLNAKKVPQLMIAVSSASIHDARTYPWTVPFVFGYDLEGQLYGQYIRDNKPDAKITVLSQNDDLGKAMVGGLKKGLGPRASQIVQELTYETSDPTIDSQIVTLSQSGADTFVSFAISKFEAQAIRKVTSLGWKPSLFFIPYVSSSKTTVLSVAGLDDSKGVISLQWFKTPSDPTWTNDPAMVEYLHFMKTYLPNEDAYDSTSIYVYICTQVAALVLERSGDNLTRENLRNQATNLTNVQLPLLLPGATVNDSPDDHYPLKQARLVRFDGADWRPLTGVITVER